MRKQSRRQRLIEHLERRVLLSSVIYVDAHASGTTHDGTAWPTAFTDLQQGLGVATAGDEIHVADGTYKPTSGTDRKISFVIKSGIALIGGYAGDGAADPNARSVAGFATILTGNIGSATVQNDNSYNVVVASGTNYLTVLDGFTIRDGYASGPGDVTWNGGGMYLNTGSLTISNCTFQSNYAYHEGAGIYNYRAAPTLIDCAFIENGSNYANGAGMANEYSSPWLIRCTFRSNVGYSDGGGIYNFYSSSPTLDNCSFFGNKADHGGGIYNSESSSPLLTNCIFGGNVSTEGGAVYSDFDSSPKLVNALITGNVATRTGGGVSNGWNCAPTLINCTIVNNLTYGSGAEIFDEGATLRLINCIVWGNGTNSVDIRSTSPNISYSDIRGGFPGNHNVDADPMFVRSPWAGPDGKYGTADDDYGDLRLRVGSPLYNIGNTGAPPADVTDLAGGPRVLDGWVDLGAYEGLVTPPAVKVIYVDRNATGANSGISWNDAFTNLQSALGEAADGDTIRVADGTYTPTTGNDRTMSFTLRSNVGIFGGYAGSGAADPNTRNFLAYPTILSGNVGSSTSSLDNSQHVVTALSGGAATRLDGLTITEGYTSRFYDGIPITAAGISQVCGATTITDCIITNNRGDEDGGGMSSHLSSSNITRCTFSNNTYRGMYNTNNSSPVITDCTFSGNFVPSGSGGAMLNNSSSPVVTNCTFTNNSVDSFYGRDGGAVENFDSSAVFMNCTFTQNQCADYYGRGGGMHNYGSSPTLIGCMFSGNNSEAIYSENSSPRLVGCVINGHYGSGLTNYNAFMTLENCIITRNSNGITQTGGSLSLTNCVIAVNNGMGVSVSSTAASTVSLADCTLTANLRGGIDGIMSVSNCIIYGNGRLAIILDGPTVSYSCVDVAYPGTGNISAEPHFVRSPWAGPDGAFNTADDDLGDLRLRANSPGLDAGSNAAVPAGITQDAAGNARIQGTTVDMGAYEGAANVAPPHIIYVDANAPAGGNGASWANAYTSFSVAIASASDGDTIRVAGGIYKPTTTTDREASFGLRSAVSYYGGYAGYGTANPDARNTIADPTVLSGDIGAKGVVTDNSFHVVRAVFTGISTLFDGFTVTLGYGSRLTDHGAGLCLYSASPTISNCTFVANANVSSGGAVVADAYSQPTILACQFTANSANQGGAIANYGVIAVINCVFSNNTASKGGAAYNGATATFTNCTFVHNAATSSGGAIYDYSGQMTVTNCIIWDCGGSPIHSESTNARVTFSDVQGGYSGTGNIDVDPLFMGSADGDFRLQSTSPCIDAGSSSAVPVNVTTDAAAYPRIIDYPGVHDPGAIVDIGAFERPAPLSASGGAFLTDGKQPAVKLVVNNPLNLSSISIADVLIRMVLADGSLGATVNATGFRYDPGTSEIRVSLPAALPDGNYRAALLPGRIADTCGNTLSSEYSFNFFALGGDANHDRSVDINDLAILGMNWNSPGKVFSQGDFNYDGKVDAADLGILSSHWQSVLAPPSPAAPVRAALAPRRTATRIAGVVL